MLSLSPPRVVFAAQSVAGQVRRHNEDALACRPELGLWALADGMGGHARGEVASALALEGLIGALRQGAELANPLRAAQARGAPVATPPATSAGRLWLGGALLLLLGAGLGAASMQLLG